MQPYFRDAVRGDLTGIATIVHAATGAAVTVERCRRTLDAIDRRDGQHLLVAEYDRHIGAVLHLAVFPSLTRPHVVAEIVGRWTAEPFRTTRLADLLLDHAVARAVDLGCDEVRSPVVGRAELPDWHRAGFVPRGSHLVRTARAPLGRVG